MEDHGARKVAIICSKGSLDMAYPGLVLANAARMMKKKIQDLDIPDIREMLETLDDAGAELYACRLGMDLFGLSQKDLIPQIRDVLTSMEFLEKSEGAQIIFV
jgi:peroxiredoxin family protein